MTTISTTNLLTFLAETDWSVATRTVDGPYVSDDGVESRMIQTLAVNTAGLEIVTYANLCSNGIDTWVENEDYDPIELNFSSPTGEYWDVQWLLSVIPTHLQAMGTTAETTLY